jgi:hypothetical protein
VTTYSTADTLRTVYAATLSTSVTSGDQFIRESTEPLMKMFPPYDVAAFMRNVILAVGSVPVSNLCTWWTALVSALTPVSDCSLRLPSVGVYRALMVTKRPRMPGCGRDRLVGVDVLEYVPVAAWPFVTTLKKARRSK